jgi:hypothetical protein
MSANKQSRNRESKDDEKAVHLVEVTFERPRFRRPPVLLESRSWQQVKVPYLFAEGEGNLKKARTGIRATFIREAVNTARRSYCIDASFESHRFHRPRVSGIVKKVESQTNRYRMRKPKTKERGLSKESPSRHGGVGTEIKSK